VCACCCLCCRDAARVAPEVPQRSLSWGRRSREEQALEFVNVCAGVDEQRQVEAARQQAVSTILPFFVRVVMLGIACPTLYFCVLLPLQLDGLPAWCWGSYYWMCMLVGASVFAQTNISVCYREAPHWAASLGVLTTMSVVEVFICTGRISRKADRIGAMVVQVLCVLVCLYWPSFHRIWCAWREDTWLKESLFYFAGISFGAFPCAVSTGGYVLVLHCGWLDDARLVAILLGVWFVLPLVMKLAGKPLWNRGSPANRALAPVLWVYYVEILFACLGLGLFNNASGSAIAYACSFAFMLVVQVARGSQMGYRCIPCMGSLSLHRLIIFFEAFAALIGRVTSYTLFLCLGILKLARGEESGKTPATYTDSLTAGKINLYAGQSISIVSILTGLLGFAIVVSIFVAFAYLLPELWALEADGQHQDSKATGKNRSGSSSGIQHDAWSPHGTESAGASPATETQAPFPGNRSSWIQEAGPVSARAMQYHLLLGFIAEYRLFLVSTLVFVFGMCILLVDLSAGIVLILRLEDGQ